MRGISTVMEREAIQTIGQSFKSNRVIYDGKKGKEIDTLYGSSSNKYIEMANEKSAHL